jgi:ubiquinone/menaquinone biosynthesis C-methylase UbiE
MFMTEERISLKGVRTMVSHLHHRESGGASAPQTRGFVWNWARRYDLLMGLVTFGREQAFRTKIADLARLQPGEEVLDVGCGTGTLAMVARQRVGETGRVSGIDPSAQMIARASHKAVRRNLVIDFQVGVIEQLAVPDQSFDVVLSTFMMHHLPDDLKRRGVREIARVLKPGGRLLVLDMKGPVGPWKSRISDQLALMKEAGFSQVEMGKPKLSGLPGLGFALGRIGKAEEGKTAL